MSSRVLKERHKTMKPQYLHNLYICVGRGGGGGGGGGGLN
jgi:hypothetical protein